jgi:DNA-binding NarL/FixJ family response regulator
MSDASLKLLLIDQDPIFRLGLRVVVEELPDLQVVGVADTETTALQILAELATEDPEGVNLVVMELGDGRSRTRQQLSLQFLRQLKTQYPSLPVLLLTIIQEPGLLLTAKAYGIDGYCVKGTPITELITAMQEVAAGGSYWVEEEERERGRGEIGGKIERENISQFPLPFFRQRNRLRLFGIRQIEENLAQINSQLQTFGLSPLEKAILAGQRRELLATRWLVNQLSSRQERQQQEEIQNTRVELPSLPSIEELPNGTIVLAEPEIAQNIPPLLSPRALQSVLFASCINKLQYPLQNISETPLEIDIFKEEKKRELLYLILQKIADTLDELRNSQVELNQLEDIKITVINDLWRASTTDFFGKFSRVNVGNKNIEIVNVLLQDIEIIQTEILNQIPFVEELFSYLLFQTDLQVDNTSYPVASAQAKEQGSMLLENLLIQIANAVIQPMLNRLADIEQVKQNFYDRKFISTREIERFRNDLSWKYRLKNYVTEPRAIFESRYELFVFAPRGIAKTSIYAPRKEELTELSGIPLVVTLGLEFWDATSPRLQTLLSFLGSGVVFFLTQIVGKSLGLIGRGILQGIGNVSLRDKNWRKNK